MNSALNPEAPEFYPHLTSVTQGGYTTVNKTIRSSNNMPSGASYELFKTFTDFNIVTCQIRENVIIQSNQIITSELPAVKLKRNDDEYNTENITNANDSILDRVHFNLDTASGAHRASEQFLEGVPAALRGPAPPLITKLQVGSTTFIGAKNIPRPQVAFKDTIDNSDSLWVPKISDKPNNFKPLALNILYNDEGEAVGYEHPYKVELELWQPPEWALQPTPTPPEPAPPLADSSYTYVDTPELLDRLVDHLHSVSELAVDVEHHSYRTYQGITCLIQITTDEGGDFLVDALAVRDHVHKLNQAFTDPKKIKVFHGAEMDVLWLQRDFGVYVVGLFDTHLAARALNASGLSLKYLLMKYCGVNADKKYQLADWRIRPLPAELVQYARQDTHHLLYIWRRMRDELLAAAPALLASVFDAGRQICGTTYNKEVVDDSSHLPLYVRSKKSFNSRQLAALQLLYKWRDSHARSLDESTTYLLPNHMLLSLAETLPREVQGVHACCSPMPPFVKQNLIALHRMLLSCRELPMEPQLYQMPAPLRSMAAQPLIYNVHDPAHLPDFREDEINLERAAALLEAAPAPPPDVPAFEPARPTRVSALNVDAKLFIPPYDRYRKYRALAQMEEIKEFKDKEAKIAAISKGNELIKTEVLLKIQQAKTQVEGDAGREDAAPPPAPPSPPAAHAGEKRKRKMSTDKLDQKEVVAHIAADTIEIKNKNVKNEWNKTESNNKLAKLKPFGYKNVNYRKFYDDSDKAHKQPKMKFKNKKHK